MNTHFFSELVMFQPDVSVVKWLRDPEPEFYISALTIGEIRRGTEGCEECKKNSGLQMWLTGLWTRMECRILSFNTSVAHVWGHLVARCDGGTITLPSADSQLAATAHLPSPRGRTRVTRNVADFRNVGVKLLNPSANHQKV